MSEYIEIVREISDTEQIVYRFWKYREIVYLDSMIFISRESKRHKFKTDYSRSYTRIDRRNYGMKEEPEIDLEIQIEAVRLFRKNIRFERWP